MTKEYRDQILKAIENLQEKITDILITFEKREAAAKDFARTEDEKIWKTVRKQDDEIHCHNNCLAKLNKSIYGNGIEGLEVRVAKINNRMYWLMGLGFIITILLKVLEILKLI
jgi:hypothetical protein